VDTDVIPPARQQMLAELFITPIFSDREWHKVTKELNASEFRRYTWAKVDELRANYPRYKPVKTDWPFILGALWIGVGRPFSDLKKCGSTTGWETYQALFPPEGHKAIRSSLQSLTQEPPMHESHTKTEASSAPAVETRVMVFGVNAAKMTDAELILAIKRLENEIDDLKSIKSNSKKVNERIASLGDDLGKVIEILDAR
jgi:hypothetical protein